MQLVAYGAQDIYLTGNPQITFFKVVYRRHTNFSMESIAQDFNGTASFNSSIDCTISRNGDLIHKIYAEFDPKSVLGGSGNSGKEIHANIGHTLLKEMELEIGGQRIDKQYSHWLTTYSELTEKNPTGVKLSIAKGVSNSDTVSIETPERLSLNNIRGDTGGLSMKEPTEYQLLSFNHMGSVIHATDGRGTHDGTFINGRTFQSNAFVPLQFWFCRNIGLALPLIALQYHEVKVKIKFCPQLEIGNHTGAGNTAGNLDSLKLWVDYIYLDTDERRRFAQVSHEYLIEQLQTQVVSNTVGKHTFNFNHPVKEIIWIGKEKSLTDHDHKNSSGTPSFITGVDNRKFKIKLNGHDRFESRHYKYFTQTQIYEKHTGFGGVTNSESIAVYSFSLKPEEHQPSGTCNFSRIDNSEFMIEGDAEGGGGGASHLRLYAVNYNVLRIMSGMGGLAYSN